MTKVAPSHPKPHLLAGMIRSGVQNKACTLASKTLAAGAHQIQWNAAAVEAGVYFIQMQTEEGVVMRKVSVTGF